MEYRNSQHLENGQIDCEINHPDFGWIPFTCDQNDSTPLFDVAVLHEEMNNDSATLAYVPPTVAEILYEQTLEARLERNQLLLTVDAVAMNPLRWPELSQENQDDIAVYRQELLDITDQAGFPTNITWPTVPSILA
jgi:hypothetical protein